MEMTNVYGWNISNNTKTISYSPLDEYAGRTDKKNLDVMYAIAPNQTQTKENGGRVKFHFKHILSQVVFKAKTQLEIWRWKLMKSKFIIPGQKVLIHCLQQVLKMAHGL